MPVDLMYGTPSPQATTTTEYASRMKKDLEVAYQNVRENMGQRLDRQKELYDLRIHGTPFETGDKVWLLCVAVPRGRSKKFHNPWKGPFQIIKRISDVTYQIQNLRRRSQRMVVHFNRLKRYPPSMRTTSYSTNGTTKQPSNRPPPIGTNLQLIDESTNNELSNIETNSNEPNRERGPPIDTNTHRYPRRVRTAPDYYHDKMCRVSRESGTDSTRGGTV